MNRDQPDPQPDPANASAMERDGFTDAVAEPGPAPARAVDQPARRGRTRVIAVGAALGLLLAGGLGGAVIATATSGSDRGDGFSNVGDPGGSDHHDGDRGGR